MSDVNDVIPVAAGEPARKMIKAWAESHGLTLYQGREGSKYPVRRYMKFTGDPWWDWEYEPWSGAGPAIALIHPFVAILDADDEQARELVASWDLPQHFATRGVSYSKQVVTEHHYFSYFDGLKRILGMCPGLDFLSNPRGQELWIKIWDTDYEVLSTQLEHRVPALPDHVVSLHGQAVKEQRQRSAADGGGVPVEKYRAEGIPSGYQSNELFRSACNLAARRVQPDGILAVLTEIVEHSELTKGPWHEHQLASMSDRAYRWCGKPPLVVEQMEMEDPDPALYPADRDQDEGQELESAQEPEQKPENPGRHVTTPRLRVAPPDELAEWADRVIKGVLAPIWKVTYPARMASVEIAAEVFGWLGDLDLLDYQRAAAILKSAVLPSEYTDTVKAESEVLLAAFDRHLKDGWNKGATEGHDVPPELQVALDAWHPPCPIPREDIEAHRLPEREGRWPVQNYVAMIDDRGNARRLLDHYGDRILFVDGQKGLGEYAFDGERWLDVASGGPGLVAEFADRVIQVLPVTEAMSLSVAVASMDDDHPVSNRGDYWKWLSQQQSNARRSGMIASAVTIEGMRVPVSVFDADPRWLNTPGGELDLGLLEIDADGRWHMAEPIVPHLGQHYPEHYCSRITGVAYDSSALCPAWEQALKSWLDDDELIVYLGKLLAASLRGLTIVKMIALLLGPGNSGKSTLLEVIMAVLGSYATAAAPTILRKGKGGGTLSDDIAELRGFRFVSTTETAGAEEMDEPRIKRLSGGDRQRARGLYQSSSEFDVQFLLWYATNFVPRLSGEDTALWGRFGPVMFPHVFTESGIGPDGKPCGTADPTLKKRLIAEGPGILAWIVRHLEKLYAEGLCEPASVTAKRQELQGQQDTSGQFIALAKAVSNPASAITEVSPRDPLLTTASAMRIRWTSLYRHYEAWATFSRIHAVGKDSFRASLENHGHKFVRPSNVESVTGFGHRASDVMAQCPVCEEQLKEPKKTKSLIQRLNSLSVARLASLLRTSMASRIHRVRFDLT